MHLLVASTEPRLCNNSAARGAGTVRFELHQLYPARRIDTTLVFLASVSVPQYTAQSAISVACSVNRSPLARAASVLSRTAAFAPARSVPWPLASLHPLRNDYRNLCIVVA